MTPEEIEQSVSRLEAIPEELTSRLNELMSDQDISEAGRDARRRELRDGLAGEVDELEAELAKALGGEFVEAAESLSTVGGTLDGLSAPDLGLAEQLREAQYEAQQFQADLNNLRGGVSYSAVSGQGGFDYLFRGPASGYSVPVILHGQERLTAGPAGEIDNRSVVFNVSVTAGSGEGGRSAGEAFVQAIQRALDTKRLLVPGFAIDATRV
jgi:hypothetical protein